MSDEYRPGPTSPTRGPNFSGPGYEASNSDQTGPGEAPEPRQSPGMPDVGYAGPTPVAPPSPGTYAPIPAPPSSPAPTNPGYGQQPPPSYGYNTPPSYGYGSQGYGYDAPPAYGNQPAPYPPQYGYGYQPGYGGAGYYPEHPQSSTVLVLGIVGMFVGICAPIAWYLGRKAQNDIANGAPYRWTATGKTGHILGIVFTVLQALFWGLFILGVMADM